MNIQENLTPVQGSFSVISTKEEYKFIDSFIEKNIAVYNVLRRGKNLGLIGNCFIIEDAKSVYYRGNFLGNVKEVNGGFIPAGSVTNYHKKKTYKRFSDAKNYLIHKRYLDKQSRCFSYLAKEQFYYTKNHLENLSIIQIAQKINQFTNCFKTSIKIVKKYKRSNITNYLGQNGYILSNGEKINNL